MPEFTVNITGTVTIACPDIAALFAHLVSNNPAQQTSPVPAQNSETQTNNVPDPVSTQPAPTTPPTTAAPAYTKEQLIYAGTELIRADPSKLEASQALIAQFNIQSLDELTEEQFAPFAVALRGLGAQI